MSTVPHQATIDDLISFHQQLTNLSSAGMPIRIGDQSETHLVPSQLQQIVSQVAIQVSRGASVDEALQHDPSIPALYRTAWLTWFHTGNSVEALQTLTGPAEVDQEIRSNVSFSLLQPLIILALVYVAFIFIVTIAASQLELTYIQIGQPPSFSLKILLGARYWLFVWGPLVPIVVILTVLYWSSNSHRWTFRSLPGRKRFDSAMKKANVAENMARVLESNQSLASVMEHFQLSSLGSSMPPMLSWALSDKSVDSGESMPRAKLLRFVASTYRSAAQREVIRWRNWLPALASVLIGGTLVLVYAISLFVPMIELIVNLTAP